MERIQNTRIKGVVGLEDHQKPPMSHLLIELEIPLLIYRSTVCG
jgi:hypothetical protein